MSSGKELCRLKEIWQKNGWIKLGESKRVDSYPGGCSGQIF